MTRNRTQNSRILAGMATTRCRNWSRTKTALLASQSSTSSTLQGAGWTRLTMGTPEKELMVGDWTWRIALSTNFGRNGGCWWNLWISRLWLWGSWFRSRRIVRIFCRGTSLMRGWITTLKIIAFSFLSGGMSRVYRVIGLISWWSKWGEFTLWMCNWRCKIYLIHTIHRGCCRL